MSQLNLNSKPSETNQEILEDSINRQKLLFD